MTANEVLTCKLDNDNGILHVKCFEHDHKVTISAYCLEGFGKDGQFALSDSVSFSTEQSVEQFLKDTIIPSYKSKFGKRVANIDDAKIDINIVRMVLQKDTPIISSIRDFIFGFTLALSSLVSAYAYTVNTNGYTWTYLRGAEGVTIEGSTSINGYGVTKITPRPEGHLDIPATLNGLPVVCIGEGSFGGCRGLTNVTMPSSVTGIGRVAFQDCIGLKNVIIPDAVTNIGYLVFSGCTNLTSITSPLVPDVSNPPSGLASRFASDSSSYASVAGCYKVGNGYWVPYSLKTVNITSCPDDKTDALNYYFNGLSSLTNIVLPSNLTSIGTSAFSGCNGLTSISIPNGVTNIGNSAFSGCDNLARISLPDGVASIGNGAFARCYSLTNIFLPNSVTSIGGGAFNGCYSLTDIVLPNGVTSIGQNTFYQCSNLTNVLLPNSVTNVGASAFSECSRLATMSIPNSVTSVGASAFSSCNQLTKIILPNSVTNIGLSAFSGCNQLTDMVIPQVICSTNMASMFPASYQSITNVVIADGVTRISAGCFSGCESLESVTIPASVTRVDTRAFESCTSLKSIRFLGDAPDMEESIYYGTPRSLVTYVSEGSRGWNGGVSESLPEAWPVGDVTARAITYWDGPDETVTLVPIVTPGDGTLFEGTCEVSISCATEGAAIYYTTNGTTPRMSARYAYTGPFMIDGNVVIKAVAVAEGREASEYVTVTITKVEGLTLPLVLGSPVGVQIEMNDSAEWRPVGDTSSPINGLAAQSGRIDAEEETWMEAVVNGAGTFSFWWRVSCEEDEAGTCTWDRLVCEVDGEEIARIDGITEWEQREIVFGESKERHTIRWTYLKDDYDEDGAVYDDCAWVTGLTWNPTAAEVPASVTGGKSITVEKSWADLYPSFRLLYGNDFAEAVTRMTGKTDGNDTPMAVWQDYVAGTDPTDPDDFLRAIIAVTNDVPYVSWTPNLNTNGEVRVYTVMGKTNLTDAAWVCPTNSAHRFFKVKVEMP